MDFFALLAIGTLLIGIGYWFGQQDKRPVLTPPLDPESMQNQIARLDGTNKALRTVIQNWHDQACGLGFDGVHAALESIKARQGVVVSFSVQSTTHENDMSKVVSLLDRRQKGNAP